MILNPYTIKETEGVFQVDSDDGGDVRYFGEFELRNRQLWKESENKYDLDSIIKDLEWETRCGFVTKEKEASGSTIVGSGDFYIEFSCGYALKKISYEREEDELRVSINAPDMLCSWVTDKSAQDIHDFEAVGVALVFGASPNNNIHNTNRKSDWELILGYYFSKLEVPELQQELIVNSERGYPEFENKFARMVRFDFRRPFGKTCNIMFGARFHLGLDDLNPWSFYFGLMMTDETFKKIFDNI